MIWYTVLIVNVLIFFCLFAAQVGNTNQGNNQAIFHNDANTQVGQQVGSPNYFNNNPGSK